MDRIHRRSVGFLEKDSRTWACFLVTCLREDGRWHGHFSFRPQGGDEEQGEIRTANIFLEDSEAEIHEKARGLGRPLLSGLLSSALHLREQERAASPRLRRWFRDLLAENAQELAGEWLEGDGNADERGDLGSLRSLYASYRLDQVCHFIQLVDPEAFQEAVDRILEGRTFDFRAKDVHQFAMMVTDFIESKIPLPPFEVWAADFLKHRERYALYAHALHREEELL